ncbi:hypothetical protein PN36_21325 [Candidatus Thiomargarita nelsonii]|uniref:Uncharacterized protein n=1 Tax=Candidatus Thiomargarita nelsonii TaxID=1003181 RepID=A0A0A6PIN3_9GAMM|nr:hypothetical protein PN36_21325 [Candidatus Thiomargarita nelsonii]
MNQEIYKEMQKHLEEFYIISSYIRKNNCIYILFTNDCEWEDEDYKWQGDDSELICRACFFYPKTEKQWGFEQLHYYYSLRACVLPAPDHTFVAVDADGQVITQTGITSNTGFNIEKKIPLSPDATVNSVREISGTAFIAGTDGTVFRREGPNHWTCLSGNFPIQNEEEKQGVELDLNDIGGFSLNEIYGCGDKGGLCHYNGKQWKNLNSPTHQKLTTLCCASNGKVYIGGNNGLVIEGRGDEWRIILQFTPKYAVRNTGIGQEIRDMAWYKDRLYIVTDKGLYEYDKGRFQRSPSLYRFLLHPDEGKTGKLLLNEHLQKLKVQPDTDESAVSWWKSLPEPKNILNSIALCSLSTNGELLVLAGEDTVIVYDGDTWHILWE